MSPRLRTCSAERFRMSRQDWLTLQIESATDTKRNSKAISQQLRDEYEAWQERCGHRAPDLFHRGHIGEPRWRSGTREAADSSLRRSRCQCSKIPELPGRKDRLRPWIQDVGWATLPPVQMEEVGFRSLQRREPSVGMDGYPEGRMRSLW